MIILFLDFDGVLHPANAPVGADTDFCRVTLLEAWLRQQPTVNIVISSSWRDLMTLDQIRQIFSRDLRPRFVDVCPKLTWEKEYAFKRHAEILAWLKKAKYQGLWLALDDAPHLFPPHCEELIVCQSEIGIDEQVIQTLTAKLKRRINN